LLSIRGRKDPRERLVLFLKLLHSRLGVGNVVSIPMTRADIADFIGLTIETVSRTFSALRKEHAIESINRSMNRVDLKRLNALLEKLESH
jgi:CRP/FNR family transcriptional regulator